MEDFLEQLRCPLTKSKLILHGDSLISTDKNTRRKYRIENGIPIMLLQESEILDVAVWNEIMKETK